MGEQLLHLIEVSREFLGVRVGRRVYRERITVLCWVRIAVMTTGGVQHSRYHIEIDRREVLQRSILCPRLILHPIPFLDLCGRDSMQSIRSAVRSSCLARLSRNTR